MEEQEILHCTDFLNIALEEMEHENYDVAQDFIEDVNATLQESHGSDES